MFTASGTTLSRAEILSSSNSDAAVNWASGTRTIFCTQPADKAVFYDADGAITLPNGSSSANYLGVGDAEDFKIYHDGNQTVISNANGSGPIKLQGKFGEQSIIANQDGSVQLYHNNSEKLATTSTGVNILSDTDAGPQLNLISDDPADATDFNAEGSIRFFAENDASEQTEFASIKMTTADISDGTEDGRLTFNVASNNAMFQTTQMNASALFLMHDNHQIGWQNTKATNYDIVLDTDTPTQDQTITLPDDTGTVVLSGGSGLASANIKLLSVPGGTDPVIDIGGGGPNFIRFRDGSDFSSGTNRVDLVYGQARMTCLLRRLEVLR